MSRRYALTVADFRLAVVQWKSHWTRLLTSGCGRSPSRRESVVCPPPREIGSRGQSLGAWACRQELRSKQ